MNTTPWIISPIGSQFFDNNGAEVDGGSLTTYLAGTLTAVATASDAAGTPNTNPLTLNSAGYAPIYFSPINAGVAGVTYDAVLKSSLGVTVRTYEDISIPVPADSGNASNLVVGFGNTSTLTILGGSITPTKNAHMLLGEGSAADNLDTIAVTGVPDAGLLVLGNSNASAAITVRDNIGNIQLSGGVSCVLTDVTDRLSLIRKGSGWNEIARTASVTPVVFNGVCNGRLTGVSGDPLGEGTALTTLYYTPYLGNIINLQSATTGLWVPTAFSQISIAVPATTDTMYDAFVYNNSGTPALDLRAWTNVTTRALGLSRSSGVLTLTSDTTRTYVGSFATTAVSGQTEDSFANRLIYNYQNRLRRGVRRIDPTDSWSYNTATYRQANGSTANQVNIVQGIAGDAIDLRVWAAVSSSAATQLLNVSIGIDSTTAPDANVIGQSTNTSAAGDVLNALAMLVTMPSVGRHTYVWLERGSGTGTELWLGDSGASSLVQSGLSGTCSV